MNADEIFNFFNVENENLYLKLKNSDLDIIEFKGDNTCLTKGLSVIDNIIRHQKCQGCRLISSLFKQDILKDKIKILYGRKKNNILLVNRSKHDVFKIVYNDFPNAVLEIYNKKMSRLYSEEKHTNLTEFYEVSNPLLNLAVINIILKNLMREKNYPTGNNFSNFFVCNNTLNYFNFKYDIDHINELYHFEKETCRKILIQIIIFFKFFSSYYFLHNQPSIEFLKFDIELINFSIENDGKEFNIISPVVVYIEPSKYSSISLFNKDKVKRYYQENKYTKKISDLPFEDYDIDVNGSKNYNLNNFEIEYMENYLNKRIFFYKIGNRVEDFMELRRHHGIPLASKSFDIVCFLISLLLNTRFYENFMKNYKSLIIWKGLWKKEEYELLMKEMELYRSNELNNFDSILNIVKKYYIRFDALDYLYNSFL